MLFISSLTPIQAIHISQAKESKKNLISSITYLAVCLTVCVSVFLSPCFCVSVSVFLCFFFFAASLSHYDIIEIQNNLIIVPINRRPSTDLNILIQDTL